MYLTMSSMIHSRCVQKEIGDISQAISVFSEANSRGEIPLVLIPKRRSWFSMALSIPTGCNFCLQRFGKDMGKANPGLQFMPPFWRVAYCVSLGMQTYSAPVEGCPTSDNVRVGIDVDIIFQITDPCMFVYKLGATHFDELLSGAIDEAVRMLVRDQDHRHVYELKGSKSESLMRSLNEKFTDKEQGTSPVHFSDVKVKRVQLPESLMQSLQRTTEMRKAMKTEERQQEYQLGEIRRAHDMSIEELRRKTEQTIVAENGKKKKAEIELEQATVRGEEDKELALLDIRQNMSVKLTETKAKVLRMTTDLERMRVEQVSKAEAAAEARRVQADLDHEMQIVNSNAEMQKLMSEAESIKLDASAEAEAFKNLQAKRKHDLDIREKQILKKLAEKGRYNLIGEHGDKMVDAVMSGHLQNAGSGGSKGWFG